MTFLGFCLVAISLNLYIGEVDSKKTIFSTHAPLFTRFPPFEVVKWCTGAPWWAKGGKQHLSVSPFMHLGGQKGGKCGLKITFSTP
jgi:hypothetical protein